MATLLFADQFLVGQGVGLDQSKQGVAEQEGILAAVEAELELLELGLANNETGVWGGRFLDTMDGTVRAKLLAKLRNGRDVR